MSAKPPPLTPPPSGSFTVPGGTEGTPISGVSVAGTVTGGYAPYTYSISGPGWLTINPTTGALSGTRPGPTPAATATITVTDARGNTTSFTINIAEVTAKPPPPQPTVKYIFSTKWVSNFLNWILFIFLFGWIWMWFISP